MLNQQQIVDDMMRNHPKFDADSAIAGKPDFSAFDEKLLGLLSESDPVRFDFLNIELLDDAQKFTKSPRDEAYRVIDRRLQALRKKKLIEFRVGKGWLKLNAN
jgi:hypothetical protein